MMRSSPKPPPDLRGALPVADYLDAAIACTDFTFPGMEGMLKPRSEWLAGDMKQYAELLSRTKYPWLVLPAQTQYYGFDRIERALISQEIAEAFAGQGAAPNPMLVARALGEVKRRYEPIDGAMLARALGATRLLEVYVGHDGRHQMSLTLQLKECSAAGGCRMVKQQDWRNLPFSDEQPPFLVVRGLHAAMRQALLGASVPAKSTKSSAGASAAISMTPAELAQKPFGGDPVVAAALLASLAPQDGELARERLHELALRTALRAEPTAANRFYAAHAAFYLYRRPYALKTLEGLNDPAANTLRSLLNGNLTEAQQTLVTVQQSLPRLLLAFAVQDLRHTYGRKGEFDGTSAAAALGNRRESWQPLIDRRANDVDEWSNTNTPQVKLLLDAVFPAEGLDMRSIVQGGRVVGRDSFGEDDIELANLRHLRRALTKLNGADCCRDSGAWPVYWLLESATEANMFKSMRRLLRQQGLPDAATRLADELAAFYGGHPTFEMMRFQIGAELAEKATNEAAQRLMAQAETSEKIAGYWAQGQNEAALSSVMRSTQTMVFQDAYSKDFPRRAFWPQGSWTPGATDIPACESLRYSTDNIMVAATCLMATPPASQPALQAQLALRFHGHPNASQYVRVAPSNPEPADRVAQLRAAIKEDPEDWGNYLSLGVLLIERYGKFEEAQKAFLAFPEFKAQSPENRVALSNEAYESGSRLFWRGRPDLARPLYEIAAKLNTGSHASMGSADRLAMLDGDFATAARGSFERGQRYPNAFAYRDYLSLLYAMGHREEASAGFTQIAIAFDTPEVWLAQLVGQRMRGMTAEQTKKWLLADGIRDAQYRRLRFAGIYALWSATTDRKPGADFVPLMAQIERDVFRKIDSNGTSLLRPSNEAEGYFIQNPSTFRKGKSPKLPEDTVVKSEFLLFADALVSLDAADYPAAVTKFVTLADRYTIEPRFPYEVDDTKVALSYFALAAAKTGDQLGLERFIESLPEADDSFDVWMARAFFAAVRRDAAKAAVALERGFNVRPHTDLRPILTEYQYAEACEIVLRETGDARFARMLLDWVKKHQQIQPTFAWAYAMEATYSKVPADVTRALAMTIYLDPESPRIKKFDAARIALARDWLKKNNPFLIGEKRAPQRGVHLIPRNASPAT